MSDSIKIKKSKIDEWNKTKNRIIENRKNQLKIKISENKKNKLVFSFDLTSSMNCEKNKKFIEKIKKHTSVNFKNNLSITRVCPENSNCSVVDKHDLTFYDLKKNLLPSIVNIHKTTKNNLTDSFSSSKKNYLPDILSPSKITNLKDIPLSPTKITYLKDIAISPSKKTHLPDTLSSSKKTYLPNTLTQSKKSPIPNTISQRKNFYSPDNLSQLEKFNLQDNLSRLKNFYLSDPLSPSKNSYLADTVSPIKKIKLKQISSKLQNSKNIIYDDFEKTYLDFKHNNLNFKTVLFDKKKSILEKIYKTNQIGILNCFKKDKIFLKKSSLEEYQNKLLDVAKYSMSESSFQLLNSKFRDLINLSNNKKEKKCLFKWTDITKKVKLNC